MAPEESSQRKLFRDNALKNINSFEEIQNSLKVVNASSWIWLALFMLSLVCIIIWGLFGQVSIDVTASGIVLSAEQFSNAENFVSENFNDRKRKVELLKRLLDKKQELYKNHYLTITELEKAREEYFSAKLDLASKSSESYMAMNKPLTSMRSESHQPQLFALVFVNHVEGKKVLLRMHAYVLPITMSSYEYGYIKGEVVGVSEYPASKESVYSYLGNMNLVDDFFRVGTPFMVKIKLESNREMLSGLSWTSKRGPSTKIEPGTPVSTKIVSKVCSPLALLTKFGNCR